ncbi:MAG TPA: CBS domain-containing protein [Jatrophihabitans sp.]|nr:CBS domain-containing protein [Jatrophihabitans sp.]
MSHAVGMQVADAMVRHPKLCPVDVTVGQVQALFRDLHVHAALVVAAGQLVSVLERDDVGGLSNRAERAAPFGRLAGRTVPATAPLDAIHREMLSIGQRRLAVVDGDQHLLGLLCLKATSTGFCSDRDVQARASEGDSR